MSEPASERYLALKAMMMPRDTNSHGTIFGGVLMSYIDQAGAVGARKIVALNGWPDQQLVTVALNGVVFHEPVWVGDLLSFWTQLVRVGRTSITVHVTVEAERQRQVARVTEADITFVAVGPNERQREPLPIRGDASA